MSFRAAAAKQVRRRAVNPASPATSIPSRQFASPRQHSIFTRPRLTPLTNRRAFHYSRTFTSHVQQSGSNLFTAAVVCSIGIGGALLLSFVRGKQSGEDITPRDALLLELLDSDDEMAPTVPPGRPGTLTPEQEVKLRELWALTLKVFGVYESSQSMTDSAETTTTTATTTSEATESDSKKDKEKKRSRLNVFKRKDKNEKGTTDTDSTTASGTATPTDISTLSIADEDDKHGQTKDFKTALANSSPADLRRAFWAMVKHDHPDALLLRFLRARKWDVEKALVMMISTMHWRLEEMHVDDDIMRVGELGALEQTKSSDPKIKKLGVDFLAQMRMGKSFLHGTDKEGRPMCVVRVRLHKQGEQCEESLERFTVYTIETARMFLRPPVDTATVVFDMTDFSMANMDYAPVKFMIKCFEANYPESLGTVLVYKAPWVFNAIWSIIRGWLDPVVAGKVHFVKTPADLEQFVDRQQIPVELGGDEKWEYKYVEPAEGENEKMKDEAKKEELTSRRAGIVERYESEVLAWIQAGEAGEGLEETRRKRDAIAGDLRSNYWDLDPYIRARSWYERVGTLKEGGQVDFYPKEEKPTPVQQETTHEDLD
ncbi:CRAL/TRIO domain-containing protein [Sporormia fimetaria CBS 119925]|uniref:CRAL/TRIO domain-containing protein n=1 Tax=Sporormia fimetaria CBS 119925 TaxID=1340428 RepID=A0A6A6VNV8_9PLEO|nr:CRAL/TRIO domain-containing protein [Sporormia fimetaria CBS 119925]